jgi:ABC-type glycerol-3-phosphate transport system substrate-binding protein
VKDRFGWATVLLPEGPPPKGQRAAVSATHVGSISSLSENPEATWKFLKFMASYESGVDKVLFGAGAPGARPDCYSDPKLLQNAPEYEVVAMAMSVARAEHTPANLRGAEMSTTFNNEMGDIWLNEVGVEEGLEKANQALQEVLDKPLP